MIDVRSKRELLVFLLRVQNELCDPIRNEKKRFINVDKLLNKFLKVKQRFKSNKLSRIDEITEIVNEISIAYAMLFELKNCRKLIYEPLSNPGKGKTIDFLITLDNNNMVYCDVKTIKPEMKDSWEKFEKHKKFFPWNVHLEVEKEWGGGEIYHNMYNARSSMLNYAVELEGKIDIYGKPTKQYYVLIFCSNGFHWRLDEVEDFADFYLTGRHNPDDEFSIMEKDYMLKSRITFQKTIDKFAYFERKDTEVKRCKFICPVRGPWVRGAWKMLIGNNCGKR
jgi:hypothetical protein